MATALRYVVLHHVGMGDPHYDLMFETTSGSALAAWRSPAWPCNRDSPLTPIADHRSAYLQYEGAVSNNRGSVKRIASGTHRIISNTARELSVLLDTGQQLFLLRGDAQG